MADMLANRLRQRVTLERVTETENGQGGYHQAWTAIATLWAEAIPVGGTEGLINGTLQAQQGWRVTIRFGDVRVTDRFQYNGQQLNIVSIQDPDGRRERLVALCDFQPS